MNVAIITDGLSLSAGGGVGTCIFDLCSGFVDSYKDLNVYLIGIIGSSDNSDPLTDILKSKGVHVIGVNAKNRREALQHLPKYANRLRSFLKEISRHEKTICNLHLKLGVLAGVLAGIGIRNIRFVETYHNTYHHYFLQCKALQPFITRYICVSSAAEKEMRRRFHTPKKKLIAIPNGVNRSEILSHSRSQARSLDGMITIISVGRLSYEKNLTTSLEAIVQMDSHQFRYLIIGDGPQRDTIYRLAAQKDNIEYLGLLQRSEVLEHLSASDLVIIPSLWEGRSIFMLEAAAFGLPFILSDCPGLREPFNEKELLKDETMRVCRFGYLVKTNDITAYQQAIQHFIDHPELHDEMKKSVTAMSISNDISAVISRYYQVFTSSFALNH